MRTKLNELEIKEIINLYSNQNVTMQKLALLFKRRYQTIKKTLTDNHIVIKTNQGYVAERDKRMDLLLPNIIQDYKNGITLRKLGRKYHIDGAKIEEKFKKQNIPYRKRKIYSLNENYFEKIDNHRKAYWLGFLMADGCNQFQHGKITISLQERDKYILDQLVEDIGYTGKVKVYKREENAFINGKACKVQNTAALCLSSKKLSNDLNNLGMIPRKSLTLRFPAKDKVPSVFLGSFVLGMFDGDGTISLSRDKKERLVAWFSIIGSKPFCKQLVTELQAFKIETKYFCKTTVTAIIYASKIQSIKDLFDFMYKNSTFFLKRKYDKFIEFFEWRKAYIENHVGPFEGKWVKELC